MRTILLISILVFWVFITWCSQKWLSKSELFEKKKECIAYKYDLQNRIDKDTKELKDDGRIYIERIWEIFYSKKENSCFATTLEISAFDKESKIQSKYRIINLLTNTQEYYTEDYKDAYTLRLQELKWE